MSAYDERRSETHEPAGLAPQADIPDFERDPVLSSSLRPFVQTPVEMPVRPNQPLSTGAIQEIARKLLGAADPTDPAGWRSLLQRELCHIYVPSLMRRTRIPWLLGDTVTNGRRLYIHGTAQGVGARTLMADWSRAFNRKAIHRNDPRRVLFIRIGRGARTHKMLLDDIATALQTCLSTSELRRSPGHLVSRILGVAARLNVTAIVVAGASNASDDARVVLSELLFQSDPNYHVPLEPHPLHEKARRVAVVFVDHVAAQDLFRVDPGILLQLDAKFAELPPLSSYEEIGEALRHADIGLGDLDLSTNQDLTLVELVAEQTQGLLALIRPLLELVDLVSANAGGARPTPELLAAALPLYRRVIELHRTRVGRGRVERFAIRTRNGARDTQDGAVDAAPATARSGDTLASEIRDTERSRMLKRKHDAGEKAKREAQRVNKKGFTTLFPPEKPQQP